MVPEISAIVKEKDVHVSDQKDLQGFMERVRQTKGMRDRSIEALYWKKTKMNKYQICTKNLSGYVFPFEKLEVYQMAVDLCEYVLNQLEAIPPNRHIRLVSQIEAAVTSPAQNIAEGKGRQYKKEFVQFLYIARGSLYELVTLNEVFRRKGLFDEVTAVEIRKRSEALDRKLNGLINSLQGKHRNQ